MSHIRIGARASPLARRQAHIVQSQLAPYVPQGVSLSCSFTQTSGDKNLAGSLADFGGKGLFVKELEIWLQEGIVDCVVHSLKDVPLLRQDGLVLAAFLARDDPYDVFLSFREAPRWIGTSSLRRSVFTKAKFPDANVVPFRGNIHTRLQKLQEGVCDATFLAKAGLDRMGLDLATLHNHMGEPLCVTQWSPRELLPSPGQGILCVECREDNPQMLELLHHIHDEETYVASQMERGFLASLDGSCKTPIAALCMKMPQQEGLWHFHGAYAPPQSAWGRTDLAKGLIRRVEEHVTAHNAKEAYEAGFSLGHTLR